MTLKIASLTKESFMRKKIFFLTTILIVMLCILAVYVFADDDTYIPFYDVDVGVIGPNELYDESTNKSKYDIVGSADVRDKKFEVMFNSAVPFKGVKLYAHGNPSPVTISLYAWDKDYETTVSGTPLLSESSTLGGWDYTEHIFEAGEQPAGQYVLVYKGSGNEGDGPARIWRHRNVSKNVKQYVDDIYVHNGTFEGGLIVEGDYTRDEVLVPFESYIPFYDGDISFITERGSMSSYPWIRLADISSFSILFNSKLPFKGVRLYADGNAPNPNVTVTLYKWDTDYETTINGTPVLSEETTSFGGWFYSDYLFEAGEQESGQYVITFVHDGNVEGTHRLNLRRHAETSPNIEMYVNDMLVANGTYEAGLLVDGNYSRDDGLDELIPEATPEPGEETPAPTSEDTPSPSETNSNSAKTDKTDNQDSDDDDKSNKSLLLGLIIACVIVAIVIVVIVLVAIRKKKN
jgi:hypothetical protein